MNEELQAEECRGMGCLTCGTHAELRREIQAKYAGMKAEVDSLFDSFYVPVVRHRRFSVIDFAMNVVEKLKFRKNL